VVSVDGLAVEVVEGTGGLTPTPCPRSPLLQLPPDCTQGFRMSTVLENGANVVFKRTWPESTRVTLLLCSPPISCACEQEGTLMEAMIALRCKREEITWKAVSRTRV
jgi:hypothetical protein